MCGGSKAALWASVAANTLSTSSGYCHYFCTGYTDVSRVPVFHPLPPTFLKALNYRYWRLRSSEVIIIDPMEKRAAKSRPNHRNGHMSSSATARRPVPRNSNLENEKCFRRSPTYHGRSPQTQKTWEASSSFSSSKLKNNTMRRPKTHPELLNRDQWKHTPWINNGVLDKVLGANKLLVNVTVARSIGPLRALLSRDATVEDAIKATLVLYAKEGRKPLLSNDPASFGLHYSQFCINCLNPGDKVEDLGSRTFFLCSKVAANKSVRTGETRETAVTACSSLFSWGREIQSISRIAEPWYNKLIGCLLSSPK